MCQLSPGDEVWWNDWQDGIDCSGWYKVISHEGDIVLLSDGDTETEVFRHEVKTEEEVENEYRKSNKA